MTKIIHAVLRGTKPWKITSTTQLASVGKVRLYEEHLMSKSGFKIVHPRLIVPDFAIIIPLLNDRRLIFVWTYRPPLRGWELELPAGHLDDGEAPEAGARRELGEETGYTATSWKRLAWFHTSPGISPQKAHAFLAKGLRRGKIHREPYEHMKVRILSVREAYKLLWSGNLLHSPTVSALGIAQKMLLDE